MSDPQKFELRELAERNGQIVKQLDAEDSPFGWRHRVADSVHGWSAHNYHYQADPIMLTEEQYRAALDAACPREGHSSQHPEALGKPPGEDELARRISEQADAIKKTKADKASADKIADTAVADPQLWEGESK
jgi:hypothetical protein